MIEGTDYCYIYPKDDNASVHIKILTGKYKDTIFKYGKVKFKEENDQVYLLFAYDVIESNFAKPKVMEQDQVFKDYLGDLLCKIMTSNLDEEFIDETRVDDSQEFGL
jgi:hypothetical protein